jgi:hypothetical protein
VSLDVATGMPPGLSYPREMPSPSSPRNASWHLRAELTRILDELARQLHLQRQRGRTPAGDPIRGMVIEDGETEGLITQLAADLSRDERETRPAAPATRRPRHEIADRAEAAARGTFLPLRHAQKAFELTPEEYDALILAVAVEVEARFGRIVAYLNDHVGRTRPTVGLALALTADDPDRGPRRWPADLEDRPVFRDGLLELEGDGPLPGLAIRLSKGLLPRLLASSKEAVPPEDEAWWSVHPCDQDLLSRLVLAESARRPLTAWAQGIRARGDVAPLLVHGVPGVGRATAGRAAAFLAGHPVVQVELAAETLAERLRVARRETRWHGAVPLLRVNPASSPSGATFDWSLLWRSIGGGPVIIAAPSVPTADGAATAAREPAVVALDEPDLEARAELWRTLLPTGDALAQVDRETLAGRFEFGPGKVASAIRRAVADLDLRPSGERRLDLPAVMAAARDVDTASLGLLARKLPLPYERAELVVPPAVDAELNLAVAWVRHRHRVLHQWGFGRRVSMGHGLTALFSGLPGTGKTMAAQILARELGLDLFRIDLSQIMSKFIGETEKNLASVFSARVGILFFDEAEAILGKRSEVKQAHDRHANIEIGYLLQRMEEYDGVTILATNRVRDMDEAFLRRLHVVIDFPMPSETERLRIWQGMLPATAALETDLDLKALAHDFEISGGEIKNAALAAAYLAAAEGRGIGMDQLRRAATRELVKGGKVVDRAG